MKIERLVKMLPLAVPACSLAVLVTFLGGREIFGAPDTSLPWSGSGAGGGTSSSSSYDLRATAGEALSPGTSKSTRYGLVTGFWAADADDDGVLEGTDNCPIHPNTSQENKDGDGPGDACDPCPSFASFWTVPPGDDDCDGFTTTNEGQVGTDPDLPCPATGVNVNPPGVNDEPLPDRWPVDFNDNQIANTIDVGFYVPRLNAVQGQDQEYEVRYDLVFNGVINTIDVGKFVPVLNKSCTP